MRLDKFIADRTEYSRAQIKLIVKKGSVSVDGVTVKKSDMQINPENQTVCVEGKISYTASIPILFSTSPRAMSAQRTVKMAQLFLTSFPMSLK